MDSRFKHIAFAFDVNYLQQAFTLVESIIRSTDNCHFHCIIDENVPLSEIERLQHYLLSKQCLFQRYVVDAETVTHFVRSGTWSHAVYYKLFFPLLVDPKIERLLYIDTDTLVLNDLSELYHSNLNGFALGAVYDCFVEKQERIGITQKGSYFNSGMMLIDLAKWKADELSEKAIAYLHAHPEHILFVDQCALNAVIQANYCQLAPKYNFLYSYLPAEISTAAFKKLKKEVVLVHFTLERPWFTRCKNYFRADYRYFFRKSPLTTGNYRIDFSPAQLLPLFRQRIQEYYLRHDWMKKMWRSLKPSAS